MNITISHISEYVDQLISELAYYADGFDPGATSIYYHIFSSEIWSDKLAMDALNEARITPEFAPYLVNEMNGSMFDSSWGDLSERTGDSLMASAFANFMADRVMQTLGDKLLLR